MGVELRPLGVTCNIQCQYCYQNPERDAGNLLRDYDLDAMKNAVLAEGGKFSLFGGEPLLLPLDDLDELFRWGFALFGGSTIQTNGVLLTAEHIAIFRRYNVAVGISFDGPGELNDVRWAGTLAATRAAADRIERAIDELAAACVRPSLIITLHRGNASDERLPRLLAWMRDLPRRGVQSVRLHLLEVEDERIRTAYALTTAEAVHALIEAAALQRAAPELRIDVFDDMRNLLMGRDDYSTCVWNGCDPYTTAAVHGVEGNGQRSNCGRTNKDGIDFTKADRAGFERYVALYHTPQEHGGCQGCRFFLMCKGQCPGTALGGDWRNRSEHCEVWMILYQMLEREAIAAGVMPLSRAAIRPLVESRMLEAWTLGDNPSISHVLRDLSLPRFPEGRA